ncbi:hypothetical protein AVEN_50830-1, partial [Araneus ventricosus]
VTCCYGALNLLQREIPDASSKISNVQQKVRLWFHESKPIITVQRIIRLKYGKYRPPSKTSIKRWYEQFKGTGNVYRRKGAGRPSISEEVVE